MKIASELIKSALMQKFLPKFAGLESAEKQRDSIDISDTSKVMDNVENFLNLGKSFDVTLNDMNEQERDSFVKTLTTLIQSGVMGYEYYEINGKRYKIFLVNQIGDNRLYNAEIKRVKENELK